MCSLPGIPGIEASPNELCSQDPRTRWRSSKRAPRPLIDERNKVNNILSGNIATAYFRSQLAPELEFDTDTPARAEWVSSVPSPCNPKNPDVSPLSKLLEATPEATICQNLGLLMSP